jgi:uncharacterized protein (TIGR03643 family)
MACLAGHAAYVPAMAQKQNLSPADISDIVQMALSDHVSFDSIHREYGLSDADVKTLMRNTLKTGSYQAWRKRVRAFGSRRAHYK